MKRFVLVLGITLFSAGVLWPWLTKLGLGRLPGDIIIRRENFSFYFPITTCIVISALLTLVFWLIQKRH